MERGHAFATGDPGPEVHDRLGQFLWRRAWQFALTFGTHACTLGSCRYGSFHSLRNIFVPGSGVVYVAPEGILRYISCHEYLPPREFCAAVLASQRLDEAIGLVDDSHAWRYARGPREFILETDQQAIEAFALRYESALGSWKVAVGERWFAGS